MDPCPRNDAAAGPDAPAGFAPPIATATRTAANQRAAPGDERVNGPRRWCIREGYMAAPTAPTAPTAPGCRTWPPGGSEEGDPVERPDPHLDLADDEGPVNRPPVPAVARHVAVVPHHEVAVGPDLDRPERRGEGVGVVLGQPRLGEHLAVDEDGAVLVRDGLPGQPNDPFDQERRQHLHP